MSRFLADILQDLDGVEGKNYTLATEAARAIRDLIRQRDDTGTRYMKHFNEAGRMEMSIGRLLEQLDIQDTPMSRTAAYVIRAGFIEARNIEQECGKALGYPWYKDDQKNFPGATEADGVCVGEHVPETIVSELCGHLKRHEYTVDLLVRLRDIIVKENALNGIEYRELGLAVNKIIRDLGRA